MNQMIMMEIPWLTLLNFTGIQILLVKIQIKMECLMRVNPLPILPADEVSNVPALENEIESVVHASFAFPLNLK